MILENDAFKKLKLLKTQKYFDLPMKKLHNRGDANVHHANWDIGLVESFKTKHCFRIRNTLRAHSGA